MLYFVVAWIESTQNCRYFESESKMRTAVLQVLQKWRKARKREKTQMNYPPPQQ